MKTTQFIATLLATAALAAGCQKSQEYYDAIYFTGTEASPLTNVYIDGPSSIAVSITSTRKAEADISVEIEVDEAALATYNANNGTAYELLPAGSYSLSSQTAVIEAGSCVSGPLNVVLESMDDIEFGTLYCLPLRIKSCSDGTTILAASERSYIIFNQLIKTRGVDLQGSWNIDMTTTMKGKKELDNLPACTVEIRMYANGWSNMKHGISSLIGVEENFMLRIGDVSIGGVKEPKSILNIAGRGSTLSALDNPLSLGRWYHVAAVDNGSALKLYIDGVEVASVSTVGRDPINLGYYYNSSFCIGRSADDYRRFRGWVSEARVWKRALAPIELLNNQCQIDPATAEGLIGYWRLDEAEGRIFKDISGNGYDGEATTTPVWTGEIHCPVVD
ncbi:DUF1735 and LamG domain-containing protein [Alistipes sp.]|uniref:DUF1735 and LamG domain-containing protein n=1 Tax=Alistipes sp. TaxID=1872444 RepID=UPI003AF06E12